MENKVNQPIIGMKLSKPQDLLESGEFSLLNNGNIQSYNGFLRVSNEASNILCSSFKPGFKVIGLLPINVQNRTIYFLVNSDTQESEIGFINNITYDDLPDKPTECKECNTALTEVELNTLKAICSYTTIISATCLNFDINYPISATYEIGVELTTGDSDLDNTTIFFTDFLNPRRYFNINSYPREQIATGDCNTPIYNDELNCNAIRVVKQYQQPCITLIDTLIGGSNKAGVYQFAAAYSSEPSPTYGIPLTDYSLITNPISLFSLNRTVTVATDYNTDKSIKIEINNIDTQFQYINLVVLKTINSLTEAFIVATLPINSDSISYTYTGNNYQQEVRITFEELQKKRAIYEYAKGVTTANEHLIWYNLKDQREWNLQPVISTIRPKWQTSEVKEGFYKNPISSDYVSYERDEVYPLGISLKLTNGYETATFPFVNHDKQYYQDTYNVNVDQLQISHNVLDSKGCSPEPLNKLWQVYNTAQLIGQSPCYSNPTGETTIEIPIIKFCFSDVWTDGEAIPLSCCTPSGDCDVNSEDYCCCEQITVTPSGTVELPVYDCTNLELASKPHIFESTSTYETTNPITSEDFPDGVTYAATPTFVPQSNLCSTSRVLYPSNSNSCPNESLIGTDATDASDIISINALPYLYFTEAGAATVPPSGQTDCDDNIITPVAGSYWINFQAISTSHLLRVVTDKNAIVKVFQGEDCDSLVPVVNFNSNSYPTCGEGTNICITLNNLVEGTTYYIQTFVTTLDGDDYAYGNICLSTPTPESFETYDQAAVFRWECYYRDGEETYTYPTDPTCLVTPYQYGDFGYSESILTYPENEDVWGDLCGQPIRHFRFPDCCISHIHNDLPLGTQYGQYNKIYPLGFLVEKIDIKAALNQAVTLGLISSEEKLQVSGYSIKRGNRRNNRSIKAKGLLFDMWKTRTLNAKGLFTGDASSNFQYYPNYPYNDLNDDVFLLDRYEGSPIEHPFKSQNYLNNRYTFHSPNTSFNKPELGSELKLETIEWGLLSGTTSEVEKHAKYALLTRKAYDVAKTLAGLQINHEASIEAFGAGDSPGVLGTSGGAIINYIIYYAIGLATGFATNYTKYTNDWLEIIKGLGQPKNPAIYQTSVGYYNDYCCVPNDNDIPKRRELSNYKYLDSGNYQFAENGQFININNFERESSVYLSIDSIPSIPFLKPNALQFQCSIPEDTSRVLECETNKSFSGNVTSYYASIKDFIPDQYGTIDQIEWIDTGYCGTIDWDETDCPSGTLCPSGTTYCDTIFGGDTYINRFGFKRKMPYFTQDAVGLAEETPMMYQYVSNVGFPTYFFNSLQNDQSLEKFQLLFLAPPLVEFTCLDPNTPFYYNGNFYLYNYGIPYFICESDYNVDLRHAEDSGNYKDFYPNVGSIVQWTQQYKNPISFDNTYYYNTGYSKQNRENFYHILPNNFTNSETSSDEYPNRLIYSAQGTENWLEYRAIDFEDFALEDGRVIGVTNLNQQQVLVRQENTSRVFNAFITVASSLADIAITVGEMFNQKPREYYRTDLGFGGSSHSAITVTPFGAFWVDTQNPSIQQLQGDSLKDITRDKETGAKIQWFNEYLPFNITKDFPTVNIDNSFQYFGISIGWDNKYDRLFITKKDYKLRKEYKNQVTFSDNQFIYNNLIIFPTNLKYFEDKSWTIAYSPLTQSWISFYDFKPNYYNSLETYFQTGINYTDNAGVYNHLQTNKHFQTFYGTTYPFILEYSIKSNLRSNILNSITTYADFERWDANLSYYVKNTSFYDVAEVYNNHNSTGKMNLIVKEKNNLFQNLQDGKIENGGINSLTENVENFWSFNSQLYNRALNNQPLYTYQDNPYRELNPLSLTYTNYINPYMLGDWFSVRLTNNKTPYRIEHKFNITKTSNSTL